MDFTWSDDEQALPARDDIGEAEVNPLPGLSGLGFEGDVAAGEADDSLGLRQILMT